MLNSLFPLSDDTENIRINDRVEFLNKDLNITSISLFTALKNAPPLSGHNAEHDDDDGTASETEPIVTSYEGVNSIEEVVQPVMQSILTENTEIQQNIIDEKVKNIISKLNDGQQLFVKYCITLLTPLLLHIRNGSTLTPPKMPGIL